MELAELVVKFKSFLSEIEGNKYLLWEIPITKSNVLGSIASKKYLIEKLGCNEKLISKCDDYCKKLTKLMVDAEVIIQGRPAAANNMRRQLLKWWHALSLKDKKNLDTFGNKLNKVSLKRVIPKLRAGKGYELVSETISQMNAELLELGILESSYVSVKERANNPKTTRFDDAERKRQHWDYLANMPLESIDDLICPDIDDGPFIQVKQLFAATSLTVSSSSGKRNYDEACSDVIKYLIDENISHKAQLKDILHVFFLTRFKNDYLQALVSDGLSPKSAEGKLSATRVTLNRAKEIKSLGFTSFYDVEGFNTSIRATKSYKPYSNIERDSIDEFIKNEIAKVKKLMLPYKVNGLGESPLLENGHIKPGFATIENANYIFEKHLGSQPIFYSQGNCKYSKAFLRVIDSLDIGLHEVYKNWGVLTMPTKECIAPFLLRLAQITGMNFDSMIYLDINDWNPKHLLTGKPCLTYWKERSTGEKEYHLDLFDAKLQWLTQAQSKEVEEIFSTIISLTAEIRTKAPPEIKNRLFLYQSNGQRSFGKIMVLKEVNGYCSKMVDKYKIVDIDGSKTQLNIARFRPSFVSQLIDLGVSIREIQLMLGHKNISTTMCYLESLDFNPIARKKVTKALEHIHEKVIKSETTGIGDDIERPINDERIIFTTPLGGCGNIFNPPEFIKASSSYKSGQPCSQYNKCLACDNVLITKSSLPELFAMQRDYLLIVKRNRVLDTPYGFVIEENLSLLDEILSPKKTDFSTEELEEGQRLSIFIETGVIDGVGA